MKLAKTTKVALRVSLSLILAMVIVEIFYLPHALWVFFVATSTASGTLGLSVRRSLQRAVMTVAGSIVGAFFHFLAQDRIWVEQATFALSFFFAVYFLSRSYTIFLFFIGILFVSIVGLSEAYSTHALIMRVVDTLVGAGCALIASLVIFPMRASDHLRTRLIHLASVCQKRFKALAEAFLSQSPDLDALRTLEEEARGLFQEAHTALGERKYERIFGNLFPRNAGLLLTQLEHLVTLLRGLSITVRKPTNVLALNSTRDAIEAYVHEVEGLFREVESALQRKKKKEVVDHTEEIRRHIMLKVLSLIPPDRENLRQWLNYHTFLHYLYRVDGLLRDFVTRVT